MPGRQRRRAAAALVAVSALLIAAAAVTWYAHSALVDERAFSSRAAAALDDSDVRSVIADRVVGGLTSSVIPNALIVRPLIVPAVAALADTATFRRVFARAVRDRHRALIRGDTTFRFELPVGEGLLFEGLRRVAPRVARRVPPGLRVPVVRVDPHDFELRGARALVDLTAWRWPLTILALLSVIGCALLAGRLRSALAAVAIAVAGAGVMVAAGVAGVGEFVVAHAAHAADLSDESERAAVRALWSSLFSDLMVTALVAALGGAVVAALASTKSPARRLSALWPRARDALGSTSQPARLARAAVLIGFGALVVLEPALLGRILVVVAGTLVVLAGVAQLPGSGPEAAAAGPRASVSPVLLAGAVTAALATMLLVMVLVLPAPRAAPIASPGVLNGCNGLPVLCARRLDEVVFPATHNSYAAADEPGWLFANQRHGIERQLRDGIRAFLIDVHYGAPDPASGRIRTDLAGEGSSRNKVARELSPAALRTADRLVGRAGVGHPEGKRSAFLCHTLCELGAEPLDEQMQIVREFLGANRSEVVILFVEPYVPVEEIERSLEQTELMTQAATIDRDEQLPTLGRLVRADTRLIILAEQEGGARPWYLDGFAFVQDTPLGATSPPQLSCERYRGSADSPLLLINHWIPPFPPSVTRNSLIGNRFLRRRLRRCEQQRDMWPNLVAVDFYERSGVVAAARQLNAAER